MLNFEYYEALERQIATQEQYPLATNKRKLVHRIIQVLNRWEVMQISQKNLIIKLMKTIYRKISQSSPQIHNYAEFQYLLQEFKKVIKNEEIIELKNFSFSFRQSFRTNNHSKQQIAKTVSLIENMTHNKIPQPNPECIGCCQVFYENWAIPKQMQTCCNLICLTSDQARVSKNIAQSICALGNTRKIGFILVGVEEEKVVGITPEIKAGYQKLIQQSLKMIDIEKLKKNLKIELVPVYEDPLIATNKIKKGKLLVRIRIQPVGKTFFLIKEQKTRPIYQIFRYEGGKSVELTGQKIYNFFFQHFYTRKTTHWNLKCIQLQAQEGSSTQEEREEQMKEDEMIPLQRKPIYENLKVFDAFKNHLLLHYHTDKHDKVIMGNIQKQLTQHKILFELNKPYKEEWRQFEKKHISIIIISIHEKITSVKKMLLKVLKKDEGKKIEACLEFRTKQNIHQIELEKDIEMKWGQTPEKFQRIEGKEKKLYYSFSCLGLAVYAYSFLSLRDIRPMFLRQDVFEVERKKNQK